MYTNPFQCSKIAKLLVFQCKLLHRRLSTNIFLKEINLIDSDLAVFAGMFIGITKHSFLTNQHARTISIVSLSQITKDGIFSTSISCHNSHGIKERIDQEGDAKGMQGENLGHSNVSRRCDSRVSESHSSFLYRFLSCILGN